VHAGEVAGAQLAGRVDLIEEDLPGRALGGPPRLDPPLQGAELTIREPSGEAALKVLEEGLGLESGSALKPVAEFGPDLLERILPGPPGPGGERFAGQPLGVPVLMGIGGSLAAPPLPHHRAYGSVPRRFDRVQRPAV